MHGGSECGGREGWDGTGEGHWVVGGGWHCWCVGPRQHPAGTLPLFVPQPLTSKVMIIIVVMIITLLMVVSVVCVMVRVMAVGGRSWLLAKIFFLPSRKMVLFLFFLKRKQSSKIFFFIELRTQKLFQY